MRARSWDGRTGQPRGDLLTGLANWGGLSVLDDHATRLLTASTHGRPGLDVALWNLETRVRIATLNVASDVAAPVRLAKAAFARGPRVLAVLTTLADGQTVPPVRPDTAISLWNSDTGAAIGTLTADGERIVDFAFSADGTRVAALSTGRRLWVWELASRRQLASWPAPAATSGPFTRLLAFAPDGQRVAAVTGNTAAIWRPDTGAAVVFEVDPAIERISFTPDGRRLVSVHNDRRVLPSRAWLRLLDADTGAAVLRLDGHTRPVVAIAMDPMGQRLVSASHDGTARVWPLPADWRALQDRMMAEMPRCLSPRQRRDLGLAPAPPRWCLTGPQQEGTRDPAAWQPRWPYEAPAWQTWLAARDRGTPSEMPAAP